MTVPSAASLKAAQGPKALERAAAVRLPAWFRQEVSDAGAGRQMKGLSDRGLHTVCREACCPNTNRCLKSGQLTFMILGTVCTRGCRFCAVGDSGKTPCLVDADEPQRIARLAKDLALTYAVITSVTRDDLEDGGAGQFVRTAEALRSICGDIGIEILVPDFRGRPESIQALAHAPVSVVGHNLETVPRLYAAVRPRASYARSLSLLGQVKKYAPQVFIKSSLMLGMGETEDEVTESLRDLRSAGCDILTLGQYLAPSKDHYPVREFIPPEQFLLYREKALALGFRGALCGPLVRSSYRAEELYKRISVCMTL